MPIANSIIQDVYKSLEKILEGVSEFGDFSFEFRRILYSVLQQRIHLGLNPEPPKYAHGAIVIVIVIVNLYSASSEEAPQRRSRPNKTKP